MKCVFEVDYLKKNIEIDRKLSTLSVNKKLSTITIDKIVKAWLLEKRKSTVSIDKEKYKIITVRVPIPGVSDWVIVQNDYLPTQGSYFLN